MGAVYSSHPQYQTDISYFQASKGQANVCSLNILVQRLQHNYFCISYPILSELTLKRYIFGGHFEKKHSHFYFPPKVYEI